MRENNEFLVKWVKLSSIYKINNTSLSSIELTEVLALFSDNLNNKSIASGIKFDVGRFKQGV